MATTKEKLFQWACLHLGQEFVTVDAPATVSPTAAKLRVALPAAAELILSLHPWNFARKGQWLSLADAEECDPTPYDYAFTKPAAARVNWISPTGKEIDRLTGGWDDRGGYILSNRGSLFMDLVSPAYATDAKWGAWPAPPAQALASAMADLVSKPITQSRATQADLSARTDKLLSEAHTWDAQQSPALPRRMGRFNMARRGFYSRRDER